MRFRFGGKYVFLFDFDKSDLRYSSSLDTFWAYAGFLIGKGYIYRK